jgi:Family of unknown function (DUF5961)
MPSLARRLNVGQKGYEPARPIRGLTHGTKARRFVASLSDDESPAKEDIKATDFLQAALTFAETCAADHAGETMKVCVTDADTGETHCFSLNLAA